MNREGFFRWLLAHGQSENTAKSHLSRMTRLEAALPEYGFPYNDLDAAFADDAMKAVIERLQQSMRELPGTIPPKALVPNSTEYLSRLESALRCARNYRDFCSATTKPASQADSLLRLDFAALDILKTNFLAQHTDFETFAKCPSFAKGEGDYKRTLARRAQEMARHSESSDEALGAALLDLASGKSDLLSNLIDWRASALVDKVRTAKPGLIEGALGTMVRSPEPEPAVNACVAMIWPALVEATPASKPYAESRMVPTMISALVHPDVMLGIRSTPTNNAHIMLLGKPLFAWDALSSSELASAMAMAREIKRVMSDDWGWGPRDLWDVQGFIWVTCQKVIQPRVVTATVPATTESSMSTPTNLILYGPPGTGKTYATAYEAVRLCESERDYPDSAEGRRRWLGTGEARKALMGRYRELVTDGRIGFVTFHQSYSYEDFVEGLRPPVESGTAAGNPALDEPETPPAGGLRLTVHDGLFKRIADRARLDTGGDLAGGTGRLNRDRSVFKISLGRRGSEEAQIRQAMDDGIIHLGWGGEVDWSDERFDSFAGILEEWQRHDPEATGKNANVEQVYALRALMRPGDYVVASDGRDRIRGFGQVTGEYQFAPDVLAPHHRRTVKWLWCDNDGVARDLIYPNWFRQHSLYELNEKLLDWDALDKLVFGAEKAPVAEARPHVLIIDEINRGNISKVFGELITLLESDKRLGHDNALEVLLPYSQIRWGVPANLHVVGTMNTADRSIALLDTALRRRFTFREMAPEPALLRETGGIDLPRVLTTINQRIEYLVGREHRIGHAFFMGCDNREAVNSVMRNKVIPLLQEYFFEDWSRIHAVLGDGFIGSVELVPPPGIEGPLVKSWFAHQAFALDAFAVLLGKVATPPSSDEPEPDEAAAE